MAAVEITISGVLIDKYGRTIRPVTIVGEATLTGLGVGGGPILPPPGGGGGPPVDPGYHPEHPIYWPPGSLPHPEHPIYMPGPHPEHPIVIPPPPTDPPVEPPTGDERPMKPPPPDGGWGFHPDYGWGYFPGSGEAGPKRRRG